MPRRACVPLRVIVTLLAAWPALATRPLYPQEAVAAPSPEDFEFFEKKVRPLLAKRCWECHGAEVAESQLRLDSLAGVLQGGQRGAAVNPEQPELSLLVLAINHADQLHMPPKSKIPAAEIAVLTDWVKRGTPWPGQKAARPDSAAGAERPLTDDDRAFWAFRPVQAAAPPRVNNRHWPQSALDQFILARLEARGIEPAPPADKRTLIRRATLDLTGLPPTPAEVAEFLADESPAAFARVVDRLLASPAYGERWGRHWLDVARYGDSNGLDENLAFANAFRYRDYVVRAFNDDRPYDEFLREQIAGDLLPATDEQDLAARRVVATGFLSLGAKMLAEDDPVKMEMDMIDEQIETIGKAVMGMTLGCARCHDHKYDPISMHDYYALAGIFKSTRTMENFQVVARWQERPLASPGELARRDAAAAEVAAVGAEIDKLLNARARQLADEARRQLAVYLACAWRDLRQEHLLRDARPLADAQGGLARQGVITIEAEAHARGNVLIDTTNYGQGIGVLVNKGESPNFVELAVEIAEAGQYQIDARYAAAESRPCLLVIDGRTVSKTACGKVTGGWFAEHQRWHVEGIHALRAGKNLIRLEQPSNFPHIDKLALARVELPANELAAPGAPGQRDEDPAHEPLPDLVARWRELLLKERDNGKSLFAPWWHAVQTGSIAGFEPVTDAQRQLLAEPVPLGVGELAARYQNRAEEAAAAGQSGPADEEFATLHMLVHDPQGPFALQLKPGDELLGPELKQQVAALATQKEALAAAVPRFPEAMAVSEGAPRELRVHLRGSHLALGPSVARRMPRVLTLSEQPIIPAEASGRLQLANWLTSPEHPLTARVLVNRVWQWHMGEGLVRSPDNFGRLGEAPTHPELLDWLADQFRKSGWSIKWLHRAILLSSTWQQSTAHRPIAAAADPENRLWWRMNRRRMTAEELRDSLLALGGGLDRQMTGSLLPTANRAYVTSTANVNPKIYSSNRRTIYLPVVRSAVYDFLQAFDFGDPSVMQGRRDSTTVAPQALFLLNSEIVASQTAAMGRALLAQADDDASRIALGFELALARPPTSPELALAREFLRGYRQALALQNAGGAENEERAWGALCRALVASNEFMFVN